MHRRLVLIALASLMALAGCAHQSNHPGYWSGQTSLLPSSSLDNLNDRANDPNVSNDDRGLAVFTLFAHHIPPASSAAEIHSVLGNPAWLESSVLYRVDVLAGKIPVELEAGESVFSLHLFPGNNLPSRGAWVIYLRFSKELQLSDVYSLLKGAGSGANARLIEFALLFPNGRIEQFAKEGVHVFAP